MSQNNPPEITPPQVINLICTRCRLTWMNRNVEGRYYFCYACSFILFDKQIAESKTSITKPHLNRYTRLIKRFLSWFLIMLIISPVNAISLRQQRHEHMLAYADYIRSKVIKLQANSSVKILLKNGTVVVGTFKGYVRYDDAVWIQPLNNPYLFSSQAFDMTEIYDVVKVKFVFINTLTKPQ